MSADVPAVVEDLVDGRDGETGAASWLPEHNRADPDNGVAGPSIGGLDFDDRAETTRLGTKPGLSLRDRLITYDPAGDRRSVSWKVGTREWRDWLREARETRAIFEAYDHEAAEEREVAVPLENRFMQSRREKLYAKLHDLERGVRNAYGKRLNTVMLTFTASNLSGAGDWWRCPANHLDDLLGSWSAVRRQLHRVLDGRRWEYARILEPHESGYAHVHVAVFVEGEVRERDFAPVMDAHVEHCLPAASEAHAVDSDAVSVRRGVDNLAAYLSSYVMKYGEDALDAPEHVQRFNALLWATGRRRWSVSNGAQEMMAFEPPETALEWELTKIEVRGDEFPVTDNESGVVRLELGSAGAGLDPPPVRE